MRSLHVATRSLMKGISQLGPSALAGFSLFVVLAPVQERIMAQQFQIRKKTMKHTDQRAKTLLEVLGRERQLENNSN